MNKKILLVLILVMVTGGGLLLAQDFASMPKNTITVDIGPTLIGLGFKAAASGMGADEAGVDTKGFGIGAQYERQLLEKLSVGGRFAYLGFGLGMSDTDDSGGTAKYTMDISSFSIEGHVRFYPSADTFFLDGMLGYANLAVGFKGKYTYRSEIDGHKYAKEVSFTAPRDYLKLGAKIGWRIDFGDPGGFVFEPSFGYYTGVGLGDTLGKKLSKEITKLAGEPVDVSDTDEAFKYLEDIIFIGGPRLSLSFGWRF